MEKIKIKVNNGEVTVPMMFKRVRLHKNGEEEVTSVCKVIPEEECLKWIYLIPCYGEVRPYDSFLSYHFINIIEITEEEWNAIIRDAANNFLKENLINITDLK